LRLLLASKDGETDRVFKEAISSVGAELSVCRTLALATRSIRDEKFDVIFADAQLPGLTRWELRRVVSGSKFNVQAPVVLLTDYDGGRSAAQGSKNFSVLVKPSQASSLVPHLRDLKRRLTAERRKQQRLPYFTALNCVAGLKRFRARSVNLSAEGMLLEETPTSERGDEFDVHFQLDAADPVFRARVRVVRIHGPKRMAVAFQNLGPSERHRLRRFLDRHLPPLDQ
jgi:DNA-binding response OmpR family regulator